MQISIFAALELVEYASPSNPTKLLRNLRSHPSQPQPILLCAEGV